jgi:hypothetical protein
MGIFPDHLARQVSLFLATLAFLVVSTTALAHSHPNWKSADGPHCAICMAVHSSTHAIATPVVTLYFGAVQSSAVVSPKGFLLAYAPPALNQDRAPPSL